MPRYILKDDDCGKSFCPTQPANNSSFFLHSLADKLLLMACTIERKIDDLENQLCQTPQNGVFLVSVETPKMMLGIKYEYVEYIKRYGPPCDGKFNEVILDELRKELNIEPDID